MHLCQMHRSEGPPTHSDFDGWAEVLLYNQITFQIIQYQGSHVVAIYLGIVEIPRNTIVSPQKPVYSSMVSE